MEKLETNITSGPIIELDNVKRVFHVGEVEVEALRGVNAEINAGEYVVLLGPSGSGKTTLLNQIGGIDQPTEGTVKISHVDITHFDEEEMTKLRRKTIGWIFQFHNLIPSLSSMENVQLALELMEDKENQVERSIQALEDVGLGEYVDRFPAQLSGGQQQRVAIARALVKQPTIIVADEPTGNLDKETGNVIVDLMLDLCHSKGITFVVVTHDPSMAKVADRVLSMEDGKIVDSNVLSKTIKE